MESQKLSTGGLLLRCMKRLFKRCPYCSVKVSLIINVCYGSDQKIYLPEKKNSNNNKSNKANNIIA